MNSRIGLRKSFPRIDRYWGIPLISTGISSSIPRGETILRLFAIMEVTSLRVRGGLAAAEEAADGSPACPAPGLGCVEPGLACMASGGAAAAEDRTPAISTQPR